MDVRLPDGTVVKGVPDGISKSDLATKLKSNGMNVPEEWLKPSTSVTREELTGFNKALAPKPTGYQGVGKEAVGAGEAALTAASGVAAPFTGLAKSGAQLLAGNKPDVYQNIQGSIYQPRTAAGQRDVRSMGDVLNSEALRPLQGINPMQAAELGAASRVPAPLISRNVEDVRNVGKNMASVLTERPPNVNPLDSIKGGTLRAAQDVGFKAIPSEVNPSFPNTLLESVPAKSKVADAISVENQTARNAAVRRSLGVVGEEPISTGLLDKIRRDAYKDYENLVSAEYGDGKSKTGLMLPNYPKFGIQATPDFKGAVDAIKSKYSGLAGEFPKSAKANPVTNMLSDFNKTSFTPQGALGIIKRLRNMSSVAIRSDKYAEQELGRAQYDMAKAMENLVGQNLERINRPDLLDAFKKAREQIAKTYDVEYALNPSTGDVSGIRLARAMKNGSPLSGDMKTAADFAQAFPNANKDVSRLGAHPTYSAWDFLVAGGAAAAGHPGVAAAELLGRGGIPRVLASKPYQKRFATIPLAPPSTPQP